MSKVKLTPEVESGRESTSRAGPDSIVGRAHVAHYTREVGVGIDKGVRRFHDFVWHREGRLPRRAECPDNATANDVECIVSGRSREAGTL